jgi:hypothetical protein
MVAQRRCQIVSIIGVDLTASHEKLWGVAVPRCTAGAKVANGIGDIYDPIDPKNGFLQIACDKSTFEMCFCSLQIM